MAFFQHTVTDKYLSSVDKLKIQEKYILFKAHFHNSEVQQNIRNSKEEQYQEGFLRDLFVAILGYTLNPQNNFNLTTEYKNIKDSKKADGAILIADKVRAVIELKGTDTTDLGKVETQAFGYKNNQPDCVYVITSNFEKLRFYIDNAIDHLEFNLFTLSEKDFELLYLCLAHENLEKGIAKKIKDESISQEDTITKKLYKDYSLFKRELHQNLVQLNPQYNELELFKKSQKLLDRFLFLFFAEDRQLLPPNSVRLILNDWRELQERDEEVPLFNRFRKYFGYLNTGFKGKRYDVFAYNGGLFKPDDILDAVKIDDELLYKHTFTLSEYNFASEVDVNILGHIFENSLNELDEIKAQLEGQEIDKTKTKRKKDGVFYTPKYITKYIVENTVGKLCAEKKAELQINDADYTADHRIQKKTKQAHLDKLTTYREWLLQLTICDPACGSGAFLNQALDFLIAEHRYVDELQAKLFGDSLVLSDVEKSILEHNIFGVDLNEESVEIAKLSLWLRTAQPNRKLNDLNNNIKCGNSLIDDPEIAGDKAFNWEKEFPHVFAKGGFDVVIGNPPYIKEYTNRHAFDGLHEHPCYQGKMDLWYFFGDLALDIIKKDDSLIGYIAPNNWITNSGASKFRNLVLDKGQILEFIDFGDFKVFDSAGIQTMIYIMKKSDNNKNYTLRYSKVIDSKINHDDAQLFLNKVINPKYEYFQTYIDKQKYIDCPINFINEELSVILNKIKEKQNFEFDNKEIATGIDVHQDFLNQKNKEILGDDFNVGDGIFNLTNTELDNLGLLDNEKQLIKPFFTTSELFRYFGINKNNIWVIYTDSSFKNPETIEDYPNIKKHLDKFQDVITSDNKPYGLHRARDEYFFKGKKIISLRKCVRPTFTYTDFDCYVSQTYFAIKTERLDNKYLTGLLNSNLIAFWLKYKGKMQGDIYQVDKEPLMNLPIIKPTAEIENEVSKLVSNIIDNSQKELDYSELLNTAKKENNFDREIELSKAIDKMKQENIDFERKINLIVYELYGLTEEEIKIVEGV